VGGGVDGGHAVGARGSQQGVKTRVRSRGVARNLFWKDIKVVGDGLKL